ncbi:MAG: ParB N-terminal domain-containing protein [Phycisphaeraceae bacterium]|nr:ParB N-terminal domain-containing protein [Phycisphaeraceae bacterium]
MKITKRKIDDVRPYENNPRLNDDAVDAVAKSLAEFGWRQPIVVDGDGVIIVGHTRWKAAKKLGLQEVPVHVATDLPPEKVRAYRIADNQTATLSEWDYDLLPLELTALQDADYDLEMLGFGEEALKSILAPTGTQGLTDPDEVPEPPDDPITQRGDIWVLGDHRLMCGDSGSVADLDRLLASGDVSRIDLVNMDPPYNVKVEPRSNNAIAAGITSFSRREDLQCERSTSERGAKDRARLAAKEARKVDYRGEDGHRGGRKNAEASSGMSRNKKGLLHHQSFDVARLGERKATHKQMRAKDRPLENDFVTDEAFDEMLLAWFGNASRALKLGGSFYIWGGYANLGNYPGPLKACGLYFSQGIVWDKQHPVLTRKDFMGAFEICFYGWKEGAGHHFYGPNNATDLWHIKKVNPQSMVHLTQKPV